MAFPPRISGRPLQALATLARTRTGASFLYGVSRRDMRIGALADVPESLLGDLVIDTRPVWGRAPREAPASNMPLPPAPWSGTSATIADAYRSGARTPTEVVE